MAQINIYPHEVGRDLIPELATRVYSSQLDSFREAVSNAFDEDSKQVILTISKDKITIEDWGSGIKDYDEFRKFGQASKKHRNGEVIGEKGLGKLSLLNLGNSVCFETNNGRIGMKFNMNLPGFNKPLFGEAKSFVDHQGTKITISELTKKVETDEVIAYLKKAFGLRLAQGAKITVKGHPVKPRSSLDPNEILLFSLPKSSSGNTRVTGNLKDDRDGKGIVDVYIDHVFVASVEVDTRRSFTGWVNCNMLTPETSRNNIVQNEAHKELMNRLRKYALRFPLRETTAIDRHKLMLSKELNAMLKSYIKDMKIGVVTNSNKQSRIKFGEPSNNSIIAGRKTVIAAVESQGAAAVATSLVKSSSMSKSANNSQKKLSDSSSDDVSVRWEYTDLGNEKEPIYFVPPNTIYCNTSNDLFRFATMKSRYYGPTWVRMLPYLSRIAVEINTDSFRLPPDQFNLKVDEATRYFLRQKKVIDY